MQMMQLSLTATAAKVLLALVSDPEALDRAKEAAADMPEPGESELRGVANSLAEPVSDTFGGDGAAGDLDAPAGPIGPGMPTRNERRAARFSRDAERIRAYRREGRQAEFGSANCTEHERIIALDMVKRQPNLSFTQALYLLRK